MTETTTIQLDPEAVEAAARLDYEGIEDALTAYEQRVGDGRWSESGMRAAITAYIAHIEPKVRERVAALSIAAMDNGIVLQDLLHQTPEDQKEHVVVTPELAAAINAKYAAHEAILALFGLEAE